MIHLQEQPQSQTSLGWNCSMHAVLCFGDADSAPLPSGNVGSLLTGRAVVSRSGVKLEWREKMECD